MIVEVGTKTAQFLFWEFINLKIFAVYLSKELRYNDVNAAEQ